MSDTPLADLYFQHAGLESPSIARTEVERALTAFLKEWGLEEHEADLRGIGVDDVRTCVEIKILRRVRAESSHRPPRHRRDACSMAWRCQFLTARPSQDGHVIAEK